MSRPRVFVSSTIFDFADLRWALKQWLEERGIEVQMSESSDFRRKWSANSYEACLKAIDTCDYFILFIGSRSGGWYKKEERISITRAEYEHAFSRHREGRLKLAIFVRRAVWDVREDRKALRRLLLQEEVAHRELSKKKAEKLVNHPSKFVTDAEAIFEFISEVCRLGEMKKAIEGRGPLPTGNWIVPFTRFDEVTAALNPEFMPTIGLLRATLGANLRHELVENASILMLKTGTDSAAPYWLLASRIRLVLKGDIDGRTTIPNAELGSLAMWVLFWNQPRLLSHFLDEALNSGEFLDFEIEKGRYRVGDFQAALVRLRGRLEDLRRTAALEENAKRIGLVTALNQTRANGQDYVADNLELLPSMAALDAHREILALSKWLVLSIDGRNPGSLPQPGPRNPFPDHEAQLQKENVGPGRAEKALLGN